MADEHLYGQVANKIEANQIDKALWAKSSAKPTKVFLDITSCVACCDIKSLASLF